MAHPFRFYICPLLPIAGFLVIALSIPMIRCYNGRYFGLFAGQLPFMVILNIIVWFGFIRNVADYIIVRIFLILATAGSSYFLLYNIIGAIGLDISPQTMP